MNESETVSYLSTSVATLVALFILWGCGDSGEMMSLPTAATVDEGAPSTLAGLKSETAIPAAPFQEPANPTTIYMDDGDNVIDLDLNPKPKLQVDADFVFRCDGPDPAAVRLDAVITRCITPTCADIRITGLVRNIGRRAFRATTPGDAICVLLEAGHVVHSEPMENLAPGETINLSYEVTWCTDSEFPPDYELQIHYGPDTPIDGNPDNDDCNLGNNRRKLSHESINDLVHLGCSNDD